MPQTPEQKKYYAEYRRKNRDRLREYNHQWQEAHPEYKERYKIYGQKYRAEHPDQIKKAAERLKYKGPEYTRIHRSTIHGFFTRKMWDIKRRNKECTITTEFLEELWHIQNGLCALTGIEMQLGGNHPTRRINMYRASVDRIDSTIGYIPNNTQLVCAWANLAKTTLSTDEFIYWCRLVCLHQAILKEDE